MLRLAAAPVGLLALGFLVMNGSNAAFTATTTSPANAWNTGSVALVNDTNNFGAAVGTAAFTANNIKPGQSASKCVVVRSEGSLPASVKLYGANAATTNSLSSQLTLSVDYAAGQFTGCTNFPASATSLYNSTLAQFPSTVATGLGTWATVGGSAEYSTYRFTWTLPASAPNSVMNSSANLDFVWTATNS